MLLIVNYRINLLSTLHGTTPEADEELKEFVKAFKG